MLVKFISLDSDILDSISKLIGEPQRYRNRSKPLDRYWYSSSFDLNYGDISSIRDFVGVYGYSLFRDKENLDIVYLKPSGNYTPEIEERL